MKREDLILEAGRWNHSQFHGRKVWSDENVADFTLDAIARMGRHVHLGVIEFHSDKANPGLTARFYEVVKDLRDSGSIVDLWLMDIATVLAEFGYEMKIYKRNSEIANAKTS